MEGWFAAPSIHAVSEPHILNAFFMTEPQNTEGKGGEYQSCSFSGSSVWVHIVVKTTFLHLTDSNAAPRRCGGHNSVLCKKPGDPFLAADAADSKGRGEREGQAWPFTLTLRTGSSECSSVV